jgi:hypothetical protein
MVDDSVQSDGPPTETIVGRTAVTPTISVELDRDSRLPTPLSTVRSTDADLLE